MPSPQFNETGHKTMLDRVRAAKKLLDKLETAIIDYEDHVFFVNDMLEKWSNYDEEDIVISAKQYFYIKDLYDRYC